MLFARALTNGARWYTSDVFCGYTAEELETPAGTTSIITVSKTGKVVENGA
jgi:glucose-6-phosphate isomerase